MGYEFDADKTIDLFERFVVAHERIAEALEKKT